MHTLTEGDQLKMGWLSMTEARLPPGFRFHPRDEELVCDYLEKKVITKSTAGILNEGSSASGCSMIIDVDLNNCEPWDLPDTARVGGREWYFFTHRDRKYATGQRTNRATQSGYWKATGKDQRVSRQGELVGMRKTLVFYQGRAPKGRKTNWVMHEFRMQSTQTPSFSVTEDWVLCRVFCKDKRPTSKPATELFHEATSASYFPSFSDCDGFDVAASSLEGDGQMNHCTSLPQSSISLQELTASPLSLLEMTIHTTIPGERRGIPDFSSCDGEVMKAVLCNYTEMEGKPKREPVDLDQRCSQESILIDDGLLPIWSFFQCEQ